MTSPSRNEHGFTLLEVLISIFLLVLITIAISQAIWGTFRLRDRLKTQGEFYNEIRLAMGVLEKDVTLIYSPLIAPPPDLQASVQNPGAPAAPVPGQQPQGGVPAANQAPDADFAALLASEEGRVTDYWGPPLDKTGFRASRFQGQPDKLSFVSVSNIRIYKETPESEFIKVNYSLEPDPSPDAIKGSMILVKSVDTKAFEDDDGKKENFKKYNLLSGIKTLKIKYCRFRESENKCFDRWDSESADFKIYYPTYPEILQVHIEVQGPNAMTYEGEYWLKREIPIDGMDASS